MNPVAALISKAMIEIPSRFAGRPPVNPAARARKSVAGREWRGAAGLAEDVRHYGKWMRDEAERRIGHLYPKARITRELVAERPDLKRYEGRELTVIAWLWARTVPSPNPAFSHVQVPLVSTFLLSTKKGKEAYVEPVVEGDRYWFEVRAGAPEDWAAVKGGTKLGPGANFRCLVSGSPMGVDHVKGEGKAGRMGTRLLALVAEGDRQRIYLPPTAPMGDAAGSAEPRWHPEGDVPARLTGGTCVPYGLTQWGDLFTARQLVALTNFAGLVGEAMALARRDAVASGLPEGDTCRSTGAASASAYSEAIGVYLAFALSKQADLGSSLCTWGSQGAMPVASILKTSTSDGLGFRGGKPDRSEFGFLEGLCQRCFECTLQGA